MTGGGGWTVDEAGRRRLSQTHANAVREARTAAGLSQARLGLAAGCSAGVISGLENRSHIPTLDTAWRIARSLVLPASTRRALIDGAKRHPDEDSEYRTCGWAVDALHHHDGTTSITAVTPRPRAAGR